MDEVDAEMSHTSRGFTVVPVWGSSSIRYHGNVVLYLSGESKKLGNFLRFILTDSWSVLAMNGRACDVEACGSDCHSSPPSH